MDPQDQAGEPHVLGITIDDIEAICAQFALNPLSNTTGYQATKSQILFFTLVWLIKTLKKRNISIQRKPLEDTVFYVDAAQVQARAQLVAEQLRAAGAAVTELKQRDNKRWELLRIQMEKATLRFTCPLESKAEAVQEALIKLSKMLDKMPDSVTLGVTTAEAKRTLVELVLENQSTFKGVYDFGIPMYAYAQRIVHNCLVDLLEALKDEPIDGDAWVEAINIPVEAEEPEAEEPETYAQMLEKSLQQLFSLLETKLTRMPKKVTWHTLAARSQFWLALTITALKLPIALSPTLPLTDADLAQKLGIEVNNVRVHRSHAKKTIFQIDPNAGKLLTVLLDDDLSKHLHDSLEI